MNVNYAQDELDSLVNQFLPINISEEQKKVLAKLEETILHAAGKDTEIDGVTLASNFDILKASLYTENLPAGMTELLFQFSTFVNTCVLNPELCSQSCTNGACGGIVRTGSSVIDISALSEEEVKI